MFNLNRSLTHSLNHIYCPPYPTSFHPFFLRSFSHSFIYFSCIHSCIIPFTSFNSCTRRNLKVTWTDTGTNGVLWEISGKAPIQIQIGRTKWRWTGHARKKHRGIVTRQALNWNPQVLYLLGPHLDHTRKISPGREELKRGNRWCLMLKEYFLG